MIFEDDEWPGREMTISEEYIVFYRPLLHKVCAI